jgi:hypothetical protein
MPCGEAKEYSFNKSSLRIDRAALFEPWSSIGYCQDALSDFTPITAKRTSTIV